MKKYSKEILLLLLLFVAVVQVQARQGLAIVIDPASQQAAKPELDAFITALENKQHYKVYTIIDKWQMPDSIRNTLIKLHAAKKDPIVGVILIGDIPIPMVRDAQYLTSAFKMSQKRDRKESSVPSDRFYDDFGLTFDYIGKDEDAPYYYYSLTAAGRQFLKPDIFSGRIRPTDTKESTKHEKLKLFLKKATAAKNTPDKVESVFVFTGDGSISESKPAHIDEFRGLMEHFPQLAATPSAFSYMDYSDESPVRYRVMDEMMRPDLSLAMMHHHGDWDTQYLNFATEDNITLDEIIKYNYRPNARVVCFDACYNGSFHREDCIANEYIFCPGKTIATIGGSVNLIQDKWYDKFIGLLADGVPVGYINQHAIYLESHVIGDPTFVFENSGKKEQTADRICREMEEQGKKYSDDKLISVLKESPYALVRLQAYSILRDRISKRLTEATIIALQDNYEMLQRFAVNVLSASGDPKLIPSFAKILTNPNASKRVAFNAVQAIQFFDKNQLSAAVNAELEKMTSQLSRPDTFKTKIRAEIEKMGQRWDDDINQLTAGKLDQKHALQQISFMKIYCPPYLLKNVADYTLQCTDVAQKKALLDVLGWHKLAYNADYCADVALKMSRDNSLAEDVRNEALKAYKRITKQ